MTTMTPVDVVVTGGVDTHQDLHVAAALDQLGRVLGTESFPTTTAGYRKLLAWLRRHGQLDKVGVEGTGSYGAALARHLVDNGVDVIEVARPNRQVRCRFGKTDIVDAIAAARAVLSGEATGTPKSHDGPVEALRTLKAMQRSENKARAQALNQIHQLLSPRRRSFGRGCGRWVARICWAPAPTSGSSPRTTACKPSRAWRCANSPSASCTSTSS